jgi:hypothetical protein
MKGDVREAFRRDVARLVGVVVVIGTCCQGLVVRRSDFVYPLSNLYRCLFKRGLTKQDIQEML